MVAEFTENRNLEEITDASNPQEAMNDNYDILDTGPQAYVDTWGEGITTYQAVYAKEADDKYYLGKADDADRLNVMGLAIGSYDADEDGHIYTNGAVIDDAGWDWDLDKYLYLSDTSGSISQTPGTFKVIVAEVLSPTKIKVVNARPEVVNMEGKLIIRRVRQSAQPTPDAGELLMWSDSVDDKTYLLYQDADGGTRSVELT